MLSLEIQDVGKSAILHCSGRIVRGENLELLRRAAREHREGTLILDLRGVSAIDAAGLGLLLELRQAAGAAGRGLLLLNPSPPVTRVLAATHLNRVLQVASDPAWQPEFLPRRARENAPGCAADC